MCNCRRGRPRANKASRGANRPEDAPFARRALKIGAVLKKIKFLGSKDPGLKVCPLKVRGCPVMGFQGEGVTHLTF